MIEKEKIKQGIINMLKVNMGIKSGEKLLIITDVPTSMEWIEKESKKLDEMLGRSLLAKLASEISKENFPDCKVEFYVYPSTGKHGTEPGEKVEKNERG